MLVKKQLCSSFLYNAITFQILVIYSAINSQPLQIQGITEPLKHAIISSDYAVRVTAVRFDEGAAVRKGDTILELDYRESWLEAERNRVISESYAELDAAKLKTENARIDFEATRTLHDSTRSVSNEELLKKELEYNVAKTECDRLTMIKKKEVLEYQSALERLKRHFVIAPFAGIVAQRFLNESETCKPLEPLIKLVDTKKCRFITYVPVGRSQNLVKGKKVNLTINCGKSTLNREATVDFVSPVIDASSGLRTVKVIFDNSDGSVQPGVGGVLHIDE
ncbi:MAG TPA: efflux RND transporter periplasmic adaptor subunit [Chitinispirillaceae bacterium]|nr:efflux RND transporter periplasmic adaptor subunit [Chitinispirillaceae bacterium]